MKFYGISGVANKLMESYLRKRCQIAVTNAHNNSNGYFSKLEEVQHGVPQGSVLGPLLFQYMLIICLKMYLTNQAQSYLLMTQASLLQIAMRTNLRFNTKEIFNEINK